jgi:putative ATP-dependent endonuclease of OLD family
LSPEKYEYKALSGVISDLINDGATPDNIKICYNETGKGKTLEYDLAFENHTCKLIFPDDLALKENGKLKASVESCTWDQPDKDKAFQAACYLSQVDSKGENAFQMEQRLRANLSVKPEERIAFAIPAYIKTAIEWVCSK